MMGKFILKDEVKNSKKNIPDDISLMIAETLKQLPDKEAGVVKINRINRAKTLTRMAAAAVLVLLITLPNVSYDIAYAMANLPVVGEIFKIITVRNYKSVNDNVALDIKKPVIKGDKDSAADDVNKDIDKYTQKILDEFEKTTSGWENDGHMSVSADYDVITNTADWFTLKIQVTEIAASSNVYYKYYNINKNTDAIIDFEALFTDTDKAARTVRNEIISQIKADTDTTYWLEIVENDIHFTDNETGWSYYFTEHNNLTIVFDKYVIGPGQTGCPEFIIPYEKIRSFTSENYPLTKTLSDTATE